MVGEAVRVPASNTCYSPPVFPALQLEASQVCAAGKRTATPAPRGRNTTRIRSETSRAARASRDVSALASTEISLGNADRAGGGWRRIITAHALSPIGTGRSRRGRPGQPTFVVRRGGGATRAQHARDRCRRRRVGDVAAIGAVVRFGTLAPGLMLVGLPRNVSIGGVGRTTQEDISMTHRPPGISRRTRRGELS